MKCNISPSLKAYMDIRAKYFSGTPILPLEAIKNELFDTYSDMPFVELAMILNLVEEDHRRATQASQEHTQLDIFQKRIECLAQSYPHLLSTVPGNDTSLRAYR